MSWNTCTYFLVLFAEKHRSNDIPVVTSIFIASVLVSLNVILPVKDTGFLKRMTDSPWE